MISSERERLPCSRCLIGDVSTQKQGHYKHSKHDRTFYWHGSLENIEHRKCCGIVNSIIDTGHGKQVGNKNDETLRNQKCKHKLT